MYNRIIVFVLLLALVGTAVVAAGEALLPVPPPTAEEYAELERNWTTQAPSDEQECVGASGNLLSNPSFEGEYDSYTPPTPIPDCPWGICMSAQMASSWTPYWRSHNPNDPGHIYRMPEWKAATTDFTNPPRVRSGERAQQWFTFYGTHQAGIYQQVADVTPGNNYCLSVWGHAWSSNGGSFTDPNSHGFLNQQIGIDPTGGTDYTSPNVVWTSPRTQYDYYGLFKLQVAAQSDKLTVFFHSEPLWAWKHNDVYYDDAMLVSLEAPRPATLSVSPKWFSYSAETEYPIYRTTNPIYVGFDPNYSSLEWTATVTPDRGFAPTLTRSSGKATDAVRINLNSAGLTPGTYRARVEFRANSADTINSPTYVDVSMTITQSPARFDMGSTSIGAITDVDAPQSVEVRTNVNIKNWSAAKWTATSDGTWWMTLHTTSGNNGDPLRAFVASHGLPVGVHTAKITLAGHNATFSNNVQDVKVTLVVAEEISRVYLPVVHR